MAQMGFFDLSDRYASLDAKKDPLVEINSVVPWEEFRLLLEQVWRKPESQRKSNAGRKPLDAVLMFKTLVLSALYNLDVNTPGGVGVGPFLFWDRSGPLVGGTKLGSEHCWIAKRPAVWSVS